MEEKPLILTLYYNSEISEKLETYLTGFCNKKFERTFRGYENESVFNIEFKDAHEIYIWSVGWGSYHRFEQVVTPF